MLLPVVEVQAGLPEVEGQAAIICQEVPDFLAMAAVLHVELLLYLSALLMVVQEELRVTLLEDLVEDPVLMDVARAHLGLAEVIVAEVLVPVAVYGAVLVDHQGSVRLDLTTRSRVELELLSTPTRARAATGAQGLTLD